MFEALVRGLHLISLLAVFIGTLIILPSASATVDKTSASQLVKIYGLTLAALFIALLSGLTLWFAIGKPATFYSDNPVFHAKLGAFALFTLLLIGQLISVNRFIRHHPEPGKLPKWLGYLQKTSVLVFLVIPPLAYLMARGLGYSG